MSSTQGIASFKVLKSLALASSFFFFAGGFAGIVTEFILPFSGVITNPDPTTFTIVGVLPLVIMALAPVLEMVTDAVIFFSPASREGRPFHHGLYRKGQQARFNIVQSLLLLTGIILMCISIKRSWDEAGDQITGTNELPLWDLATEKTRNIRVAGAILFLIGGVIAVCGCKRQEIRDARGSSAGCSVFVVAATIQWSGFALLGYIFITYILLTVSGILWTYGDYKLTDATSEITTADASAEERSPQPRDDAEAGDFETEPAKVYNL